MNKPILTVVVPVYNVEKYLEQCLSSLVNQTVINHKVIAVDDGSKDSSGKIADSFAEKYPDIVSVIHKQNAGLGAARNTGIEAADTPYITFLDSDDWLMLNFVEVVTKRLQSEKEIPDITFTMPVIYDQVKGLSEDWHDKAVFEAIFENPYAAVNAFTDERLYDLEVSSCRRIFKLDFLKQHDFKFPVGTYWEDVFPHFYLVNRAQRCIGIGDVGFVYRINTPSQITSKVGTSRLQMVNVFANCLSFAIDDGWSKDEIAHILNTVLNFSHWGLDFTMPEIRKEFIKRLHALFAAIPMEYFKHYYKKYNIGKREKLFVFTVRSKFLSSFMKDHIFVRHIKKKAKAYYRHLKRGK